MSDAGSRSIMSGVFAALFVLLSLYTFSGFFQMIPHACLGAINIVSVGGLVELSPFVRSYDSHRNDFWVMFVTAAGVLLVGVVKGFVMGVCLSLFQALYMIAYPPIEIVGESDHTQAKEIHVVDSQQVDVCLTERARESLSPLLIDWYFVQPCIYLIVCVLRCLPIYSLLTLLDSFNLQSMQ